jgi:acyl carrier protein
MNTPLIETVRTLAADVLGVPRTAIGVDSSPKQLESWDSIQHVSLIVAIEEQFGVEFNPDEIGSMESIALIAETLTRKLQQ